jgi:hypothetical protein
MAQAQIVSISKIRADAVRVMRGFFTLGWLPLFVLLPRIVSTMRDLPRIDLAPLRSPLVWLLVALTIGGALVARYGTPRMTAPYLWILVLCSVVLIPIGAAFAVAGNVDLTELAQGSAWVLLGAAALLMPFVLLWYWLLLSPAIAALRLLATPVPPDGTPLPTVLASPLPQKDANGAVPPRTTSPAVVAYRVAAASLGIVAVVLASWLQASEQPGKMMMSLVVLFIAIYVVTKLWRQGRRHAAIDADAAQRSDSRRPILYLRSFQDDPRLMEAEWDFVGRIGYRRAGHRQEDGPIARLISRIPTGTLNSGGRLEENLTGVVAPIGPFVTVGAPGEPLPQLGAARVYFATDSWQGAVIKLMDRAQLIVTVAGPTTSIRWELDTILNRNAWPKLVVLMPPLTQQDHDARWGTIVAELQDETWSDVVAHLDPHEVIAMRLLDGGGISAVTSDRRRTVDYVLAMRIMLHQIQKAVRS